MAVILRYSTKFASFGADYVKVVEDRPVLSKKSVVQRIQFSDVSSIAIFTEVTEISCIMTLTCAIDTLHDSLLGPK